MKKNKTDPAVKRRAAESLFTAVGEIDDRYLTEAMQARIRARKPRRLWRTVLPLAASFGLMLMFLTVVTVLLFNNIFFPPQPNTPSEVPTTQTLSIILQSCTASAAFTPCESEAELPFSDGNIRVIVGDRDGGIWISRPLTEREIRVIRNEYTAARGITDYDAPAEEYLVWISYGNGEVWSPCLASGNGNISFDCLYAYASERDPSGAFLRLLTDLTE